MSTPEPGAKQMARDVFFATPIYSTDLADAGAINAVLKPRIRAWSDVHDQPIAGRLVVFPAWLSHAVQPNLNSLQGADSEHSSVSFNFHQLHRDATGRRGNMVVSADLAG